MKRDSIIMVTLILLILTTLAKFTPYFPFDLAITETVQKFNSPWFVFLMQFLTTLGNPVSVVILTLATIIFFYLKKLRLDGVLLFFSVLGSFVVGEVIKIIIARPRPSPTLVHRLGTIFGKDSFPSDHVLFYIAFFGFLAFLLEKRFRKTAARDFISGLFLILLALIGLSRIYMGAHWFSDVLGAYLLGFIWLNFIVYLWHKFTSF